MLSQHFAESLAEYKDDDDEDDFEEFYNGVCLMIDAGRVGDDVFVSAFMGKVDCHYELLGV